MSISFQCIKCGKKYRLDNKLSGRRAKCACGYVMKIPKLESAGSLSPDVSNNASPTKSIEHVSSTMEHNSASDLNQTEGACNSQEGAPIDINYKEPMPWYLILVVIIGITITLFINIAFIVGFTKVYKQASLNIPLGFWLGCFISIVISVFSVISFTLYLTH